MSSLQEGVSGHSAKGRNGSSLPLWIQMTLRGGVSPFAPLLKWYHEGVISWAPLRDQSLFTNQIPMSTWLCPEMSPLPHQKDGYFVYKSPGSLSSL